MAFEPNLELGLDQLLKEQVTQHFITEGSLFGAIPQSDLTQDEIGALLQAGWTRRDYVDAPVMEAPQSTIDWRQLRQRHRDVTLHAVSHRLKDGVPWVGTRQEILEELLSSQWEEQEEQLRTLLHAFAYASIWNHSEDVPDATVESQENFFFYSVRWRTTAERACIHATEAPTDDSPFWEMVSALTTSEE